MIIMKSSEIWANGEINLRQDIVKSSFFGSRLLLPMTNGERKKDKAGVEQGIKGEKLFTWVSRLRVER